MTGRWRNPVAVLALTLVGCHPASGEVVAPSPRASSVAASSPRRPGPRPFEERVLVESGLSLPLPDATGFVRTEPRAGFLRWSNVRLGVELWTRSVRAPRARPAAECETLMTGALEVLRRAEPVALREEWRRGDHYGTRTVRVGPRGEGVAAAFVRGPDRCHAAVFVVPKAEPPELLLELFDRSLEGLRVLGIEDRVRL